MDMKPVEKIKGTSRAVLRAVGFLREIKIQMKKIDWPTFRETIRYTLVVLGSALLLAVFLGGVDFLSTTLLNKVLL